MRLYLLGEVSWQRSQLIYHALARLGREGLVLLWPAEPYVCLGFHQDLTQELDLEFCRRRGLPVFRREVGGGTVYLDREQVFWQVVLRRDNPLIPFSHQAFYRRFLGPVARAYQRAGLMAELHGINDLAAEGGKVCGTGAGEIADCVAFVGNLMRDFDCDTMCRVLRLPDERFRRRLAGLMEQNLTHLRGTLGPEALKRWNHQRLAGLLAQEFARLLGPLQPAEVDPELEDQMRRLERRMLDPSWVHFPRKPRPGRRAVKVRAGLYLHHRRLGEAMPGLRAIFTVEDGRLRGLEFYGAAGLDGQTLAPLAAGLEGAARPELAPRLAELARQKLLPAGLTPGKLARGLSF